MSPKPLTLKLQVTLYLLGLLVKGALQVPGAGSPPPLMLDPMPKKLIPEI